MAYDAPLDPDVPTFIADGGAGEGAIETVILLAGTCALTWVIAKVNSNKPTNIEIKVNLFRDCTASINYILVGRYYHTYI